MTEHPKNKKDYQVLDYNPDICGVEDGYIVLFSPNKLIMDGVLVIPDGIRMPDGSIIDDIRYNPESSVWNTFKFWKTPITMYAGHTKYKKVFNCLENIYLFDDEIDGDTSKNGILYDRDGKMMLEINYANSSDSIDMTIRMKTS